MPVDARIININGVFLFFLSAINTKVTNGLNEMLRKTVSQLKSNETACFRNINNTIDACNWCNNNR